MKRVYCWNLPFVWFLMILSIIVWALLGIMINKKIYKRLNIILAILSTAFIFYFTIYGREYSGEHTFVFFEPYTEEFIREMVMNIFLYLPLGLSFTALFGKWAAVIPVILSVGIELWQYNCCTGVAQGSDIIMNILGFLLGYLSVLLVHLGEKYNIKEKIVSFFNK
ncbi:MAG: VanZ family protein [Clostridia bacterium]|nr:VanZ family protein [Clostridia bacterium]